MLTEVSARLQVCSGLHGPGSLNGLRGGVLIFRMNLNKGPFGGKLIVTIFL
jgi:hypothetical protein